MQQNLKFPAQCTVISAEELEQVSGGAPAWVGELKDQIRPYWQFLRWWMSSRHRATASDAEPERERRMKKFKRMLAGLACVLAVCLCTPTAFAAKVIVYFDANGGICTSAAERTNADGQLTSLPTATMEGYTFDGWYTSGTDDVTGFPIDVQVKANDTAFGADTTVYAHWSANGGSAEVVEEKEVDPDILLTTMGLAAGSVVLVLLASLAL